MSKESDANQKLTTSIVITNVTNIQIKLLAEDIQQLQKQMENRKKDREKKIRSTGFQFHNILDQFCISK